MTDTQNKKELRRRFLAARLALSEEERRSWDRALCEQIAAHPFFVSCELLLLFSPTKGEPDLLPLLEIAQNHGKSVAFPLCHEEDHTLTFHLVSSKDELSVGSYGILAPSPRMPIADLTADTLCLLPALSFDRRGYRLGYGGGYYDRFLSHFPGKTVGPIYSCLVSEALPTGEHDKAVHQIITERGTL